MSNGIKFAFLLSGILVVMFSMTFAQDAPFQAEVIVQTARMRWGPGPAYAVQHYANSGHMLTVLEVDAESDPPYTWYKARTPSGVESWVRSDLLRRSDAPVPRVDAPTGNYPVADNNLCNTPNFRRCQDGTDHNLWEAGYWANDRYNHWERGGWDLDIVYHENPCKTDRLCTTREQWDAGRVEAEAAAATATPDVTQTPVRVRVVREVEVPTNWEIFMGDDGARLLDRTSIDGTELYDPPDWIRTVDTAGGTTLGRFQFNRETIAVTCRFWHRVGVDDDDDALGSRPTNVDLRKLREEDGIAVISQPAPADAEIHASRLNCRSGNVGETTDVVARQWVITVTRSYQGRGRISGVKWEMKTTIGAANPEKCTAAACIDIMPATVYAYIAASRISAERKQIEGPGLPAGMSATGASCELRKRTSGDSIIRQHTCKNTGTTNVNSTLTFNYSYNTAGGFLAPTPTATTTG